MKQRLRTVIALVLVAATFAAFGYYISGHPEVIDQLRQLPPIVVVLLLGLTAVSFFVYIIITRIILQLFNKTMPPQENLLFNAYSSLINFFGPGQSGPIFRAAYLKKRHQLAVKHFIYGTLLYLAFLAIVSALCVFVGTRPWWQTLLLTTFVAGTCLVVLYYSKKRVPTAVLSGFTPRNVLLLFGAVTVQVAILATMYGIQLHHVGVDASWGQILSYTGISNFSIYVAITPGAIGIREAFLVFSQNLHHIDTTSIVAANIIDRTVYLLFLGLLFVLVLALHAKDKLGVNGRASVDKQP